MGVIVRASLKGAEGKSIARELCQGLLAAAAGHGGSAFEYDDLIRGLLKVHPDEVLDELISGNKKSQSNSVGLIDDFARHNRNPMDEVTDRTLLAWCDRDPQARYPFATAIAPIFDQKDDENPHGWKSIARMLLSNAPDKETVFKEIADRLFPRSGRGSLSSQYEARLKLLDQLELGDMSSLAGPIAKAREALAREGNAGETARLNGTARAAAGSSEQFRRLAGRCRGSPFAGAAGRIHVCAARMVYYIIGIYHF